jgi:hypothetical protein
VSYRRIWDGTRRRSTAQGVLNATVSAPPVTIDLVPKVRDEELWVGTCVEAALPGVQVCQHDDGSRSSMYDLDLVRDGTPFAAMDMEVTAAADADSIELWNLVNGSDDRWIESNLIGGVAGNAYAESPSQTCEEGTTRPAPDGRDPRGRS